MIKIEYSIRGDQSMGWLYMVLSNQHSKKWLTCQVIQEPSWYDFHVLGQMCDIPLAVFIKQVPHKQDAELWVCSNSSLEMLDGVPTGKRRQSQPVGKTPAPDTFPHYNKPFIVQKGLPSSERCASMDR